MSVDTDVPPGNEPSPSMQTSQASSKTHPGDQRQKESASTTDDASNVQYQNTGPTETPTASSASQSSLLASLWSPISSLQKSILGYSSTQDAATSNASSEKKDLRDDTVSTETQPCSTSETTSEEPNANRPPPSSTSPDSNTTSSPSPNPDQNPKPSANPPPAPILTPQKTPTYLRLQKTRLSGTRTKQLLRAGSRAYNDPPPPPELGACCGSSCDPCVNDLWREERDVWREVWGMDAVDGDGKGGKGRGRLEW